MAPVNATSVLEHYKICTCGFVHDYDAHSQHAHLNTVKLYTMLFLILLNILEKDILPSHTF